jgi:Kef-type K+ transport system membrane component KefB
MSEIAILRELGVVVVGATAFLTVGRLVGVPPILGYLLAGLALGPATGLLEVSHSVEVLAEIGIALLLFLVGLELSLDRIREIGRSAVIVGTVQVSGVLAGGALLAAAFGFAPVEALFLGLAVTFSSTVVVVKLMDRVGGLEETYGRLAIGVLLVQDVLVAVALTLVSGLGMEGGGGGSVAGGLARAFGGMAVLVGIAVLAIRWGLPTLFGWLAASTEALFIGSLTWCFGFLMAAEALHVSMELGAFVAGVALAQLPQCPELRRRVHPLVDFFVAVFFVSLGASLDLADAGRYWLPALVLSAWVLLAKPAVVTALVGRMGHSSRTALLSGITLGQISEFAFVLVGMAVAGGLLDAGILSLVGLVGLVTIGVSTVLVPRGDRIHETLAGRGWLGRWIGGGPPAPPGEAAPAGDEGSGGHVVVVGMNALGRRAVEAFAARGLEVVAVDTDADKLSGLPARPVVGDVTVPSVLRAADPGGARLLVSALRIEDVNQLLAYRCRRMGVPTAIHAEDLVQLSELEAAGADHLVFSKRDAAREMCRELRRAREAG